VVLDGVGDAEVQSGLERHGLDIAEGVVLELELGFHVRSMALRKG
jgi:hypothetical protein